MTTIENHQLKGITVKNLIVTIVSTASIVASVMTTYFGLKTDISAIKSAQDIEARVNNIRIKVLESEVIVLQRQISQIHFDNTVSNELSTNTIQAKMAQRVLASNTGR